MKKYRVRDRVHEDMLQDILHSRGVMEGEATAQFLQPDFERDSHDPFLLPDMDKAVERIRLAVKNGEHVCVWSDYDCDGIPGGTMLTEFLRSIGLSVLHYIPHRHKEGYGLNTPGIDKLAEKGITLMLTVDLGITDIAQVAHANTKNIEVIITDHHLVRTQLKPNSLGQKSGLAGRGDPRTFRKENSVEVVVSPAQQILPPAFAVINPKRLDNKYPFPHLCGAGVAWKLVQAILSRDRYGIPEGKEKWLLDLVGIATLSDMVPLVGENRMLASYGLVVMRKNRRPGLSAMLSMLRINAQTLTEDDIGFMVSPRINAASRMDSPDVAAKLLGALNATEAGPIAKQLDAINEKRKHAVAVIVKEVNKRIEHSQDFANEPVIVMGNPDWQPGVLGLVANSLAQSYNKPTFLWGREGGDLLRGSCRSDGVVNVVEIMKGAVVPDGMVMCQVFEGFGGHFAAGGFSLTQERAHELLSSLVRSYNALSVERVQEKETIIDRELDIAEVIHARHTLIKLAPFGIENPKPLFLIPNITLSRIRVFGKKMDHIEIGLVRGSVRVIGISFFSTVDSFSKKIIEGMSASVVGHIETDWRGGPRVRIVDII